MRYMVQKALRSAVQSARRWAKSNPALSNLLLDANNASQFTDLRRHELMLADAVRIEAYRDGLAGAVREGDAVLDLGTGSGVLSLLAARNRPRIVYAVDHSPFIAVARKIATANHITCIDFIQANSRSYTPPEKVNVIIHEQMGPALFEENLVGNLLDLKARVLAPGGLIAPGKFDVFVEPVALHPDRVIPHISEITIDGLRYDMLDDDPELRKYMLTEYTFHPNDPRASFEAYLTAPEPIMSFDLNDMRAASDLATTVAVERKVVRDGPLDGFCVYFRAEFPNGVAFDTAPTSRFTHWTNRTFRGDRRRLRAGETLAFEFRAEPLTDPRFWRVNTR